MSLSEYQIMARVTKKGEKAHRLKTKSKISLPDIVKSSGRVMCLSMTSLVASLAKTC